jgi:IS30 family transposase
MAQIGRPGLSAERKAELWERWKNGQSLSEIGNALGKHAASIFGVVARSGGIAPATRRRSRLALTMSEREEISRGLSVGASIRQIAIAIQRSPSTVSREIKRHGGPARYRAAEAESQAWDKARRPKLCLLARHRKLQEVVARRLQLDWSPQQISGWLKVHFADDGNYLKRSLFNWESYLS